MSAALVLVRWTHFAAAVALVGVFSFRLFVGDPAFRDAAHAGEEIDPGPLTETLTRMAWGVLLLVLLSGVLWLLLQASVMSGRSVSAALHGGVLPTVLLRTQAGHDWLARTALVALLAVALTLMRKRPHDSSRAPLIVAFALASGELSALVWTGHAGATRGLHGAVQQTADAIHLLAAGLWLGGLIPLVLLLRAARRADNEAWLLVAQRGVTRFSTLGLICIASLLATGITNSWFLVGELPALWSTDYGRCLLLKLGLFVVTVGVAGVNRIRLIPRVSSFPGAFGTDRVRKVIRALQRNSVIEVGLGVLILGLVGILGTLPPAAHPHHHVGFNEQPDQRSTSTGNER